MKKYYIGRFSVSVPEVLEVLSRDSELRYITITEHPWSEDIDRKEARVEEWNRFMKEIAKMPVPRGKDNVIVTARNFPILGESAKGIFYHNNYISSKTAIWQVMMDSGPYAVWLTSRYILVDYEFKTNGMADTIIEIAKAYRVITNDIARAKLRDGWFHLKNNAIYLPYSDQEESYAFFANDEHTVKLSINIENNIENGRSTESPIRTKDRIKEFKKDMVEMGARISVVRSGGRKVAGMPGGEVIFLGRADGEESMHFIWKYNGEYDSGEYPTVSIEMECSDGRWKEKIALWDAILDSMQPLFERK